ncbi:hypothetical protein [Yoonia sp. MH D7]
MPRKIDPGAARQVSTAMQGAPKPEGAKETAPTNSEIVVQEPSKKRYPQVRFSLNRDSEMFERVTGEVDRINHLAGMDVASPTKILLDFMNAYDREISKLLTEHLKKHKKDVS